MDCPNCNAGMNSFRGSAFRADLVMQRDSRHIEIKIFTEDDTTWTEKMRVNSHWGGEELPAPQPMPIKAMRATRTRSG